MTLSPAATAAIEAAQKRVVDRTVNPLLLDLPPWVQSFRDHQIEAVHEIVDAFNSGMRVVVLDAPTGSGKTLIAETIRRMLQVRGLYVCSTRSLQDQFAKDFDYAAVLKGRSNYPTRHFARQWPDLSAAECTASVSNPSCKWCGYKSDCPYEDAKKIALKSSLTVINTSYLLTEANGPGRFSDWPFVIADEADTLESELMGYVSVEVSPRRMERYHWEPPKKVTVADSWKDWLDAKIPDVERRAARIPANTDEPRLIKERAYLTNLYERFKAIRVGLDSQDSPWVYTGREQRVAFRPARVDSFGQRLLWSHSQRFLLMSATVISASEMLESLGWEGEHALVRVPSTFPVANRKVVIKPVANMGRSGGDDEKLKLTRHITDIVARHPGERVLVHTVSYDLSRIVVEALEAAGDRPVVSYTGSNGRDEALRSFLETPCAVLVAPSMDRGIDLKGDACRVQIIAKAPFPNLGDRQVSARLHSKGGQVWFTVQTVRTIVQMCGRAVRSSEDYAVTYILDSQFVGNVWNRNRNLFPSWWRDALSWER